MIAFLPSGLQLLQNLLELWKEESLPLDSIQTTQILKCSCKIISMNFHFWDLLSENPTAGSQTIKVQIPLKHRWAGLALEFKPFAGVALYQLPLSFIYQS